MTHRKAFQLVIALMIFGFLTQAYGQTFLPNKTYVVKDGDWGASLQVFDRKHALITYVPTGFLLFGIDQSQERLIGSPYVPSKTQDGVHLYFPSSKIIDKNVFGSVHLMFHAQETVCEQMGCNPDVDPSLTVSPGRAMTLKQHPASSNFYQLFANLGGGDEEAWGVVRKTKLDRLIAKGVVTRLTQRHPRYNIEEVDAPLADVKCHEQRMESKTITKGMVTKEDEIVSNLFKLGRIIKSNSGWTLTINSPYGGNGTAYSHHLYRVHDNWEKLSSFFAVRVRYKCSSDKEPIFISQVRFIRVNDGEDKDPKTPVTYEFQLPSGHNRQVRYDHVRDRKTTQMLKPGKTPQDLSDVLVGYPYMWTVNTKEQYFDLMEKLSDKFGDRALAGFFLAKFNRSCNKKKRRMLKECSDHSYEKME